MPYTRAELLEAFRKDNPGLRKVSDNDLFRAIAVDHPDMAKGISELQGPKAGESKGRGVVGAVQDFVKSVNPLPFIADTVSRVAENANKTPGWVPPALRLAAGLAQTGPQIGQAVGQAQLEQLKKSAERAREGRFSEAVGHGVAGVVPLIGPAAAGAGEQFAEGDIAGGIGTTAGLVTQTLIPGALARAKSLRVTPKVKSRLNPVEAEAVAYADEAGIPLDLATRSGSPIARTVQAVQRRTVGSSEVAGAAREAQDVALRKTSEELAGRASPKAASPETAGQATVDTIRNRARRLGKKASEAYTQLREIEGRPENRVVRDLTPEELAARKIQAFDSMVEQSVDARLREIVQEQASGATEMTGRLKRTVDAEGKADAVIGRFGGGFKKVHPELEGFSQSPGELAKAIKSGKGDLYKAVRDSVRELVRDQQGGDIRMALEDMDLTLQNAEAGVALPVDLRGVKEALRPIHAEISKRMPLAQRQANPGLQALQNLLDEPDFVPASLADANLSAIKSIVRDGGDFRNVGQGLAAKAVNTLDLAVRAAVAKAGPEAVQALDRGRALTRAKYESIGVLDQLPTGEPVQVFNRLTQGQDTRVNLLRDVARQAPGELPKLGRAFLEGLFEKATHAGGFGHSAKLYSDWQKLGAESKKILFKDPRLRQDLDNFFLVAKRLAENPNPSGSGTTALSGAMGGWIVADPLTGTALVLGNNALARLLFSPKGSKALTKGLQVPLGKKAAAAAAAAEILKLANENGVSMTPAPAVAENR